jgi:hypothetical protein
MDERDELLTRAWEGEILGRSYFAGLARLLPGDAPMWDLMAALEETTEALVAPVGRAHGITVDADALRATGAQLAEQSSASRRVDILGGGLAVVAQYLPVYERLCELLDGDEAWLGRELVAHEQALAHLMDAELHGRPDGAAPIHAYLARHHTPF